MNKSICETCDAWEQVACMRVTTMIGGAQRDLTQNHPRYAVYEAAKTIRGIGNIDGGCPFNDLIFTTARLILRVANPPLSEELDKTAPSTTRMHYALATLDSEVQSMIMESTDATETTDAFKQYASSYLQRESRQSRLTPESQYRLDMFVYNPGSSWKDKQHGLEEKMINDPSVMNDPYFSRMYQMVRSNVQTEELDPLSSYRSSSV